MSSMRNAVHRRNHRERAQPQERERWGILEKHKDYALRAADYNAKKARIKQLRRKAADRNPDEFHFGMMSTKMSKDGFKLGDRGNKALTMDAVRLLKTQDAGYLRIIAQKARRETDALEHAVLLDGPQGTPRVPGAQDAREKPGHMVFVGSREEQRAFKPDHGRRSHGREDNAKGDHNRDNDTADAEPDEQEEDHEHPDAADPNASKLFQRRNARLEAARARRKQIDAAVAELDLQRAKMAKHPSVGGVNKWGVKWRVRERKK